MKTIVFGSTELRKNRNDVIEFRLANSICRTGMAQLLEERTFPFALEQNPFAS
jgi:hypothetical protein